VGGTGILPFFDLIDFLLKKSYFEFFKEIESDEDQFEGILDQFKMQMFGAFNSKEDLVEIEMFQALNLINK
jgi:hypothetical protein